MTPAKFLLIAIAALFATPALAQNAEPPEEDVIHLARMNPVPDVRAIEFALDHLDKCPASARPCPPPARTYLVHAAKCVSIAPPAGPPAAACRVDMTLTDVSPERPVRRFRDICWTFVFDRTTGWRFADDRDVPCQAPSILRRDPHPRPSRADLEAEAMSAFTCRDLDGITDCFSQPQSVRLTASKCRANAPGAKREPRFVCLLSGTVKFTMTGFHPFRDLCVRLKRYSVLGESPPFWGIDYEEGYPPCETDWKARR